MAMGLAWCVLGLALCAVAVLFGRRRAIHERVRYRLELEPKRFIYVVELAGRHLVLASSEAGIQLLTELDDRAVAQLPTETVPVWPVVLQNVWKRA